MVFCSGKFVTAAWFATFGGIGKRVIITNRASGCTEQGLEPVTAKPLLGFFIDRAALPYQAQQSALPLASGELPDASSA